MSTNKRLKPYVARYYMDFEVLAFDIHEAHKLADKVAKSAVVSPIVPEGEVCSRLISGKNHKGIKTEFVLVGEREKNV